MKWHCTRCSALSFFAKSNLGRLWIVMMDVPRSVFRPLAQFPTRPFCVLRRLKSSSDRLWPLSVFNMTRTRFNPPLLCISHSAMIHGKVDARRVIFRAEYTNKGRKKGRKGVLPSLIRPRLLAPKSQDCCHTYVIIKTMSSYISFPSPCYRFSSVAPTPICD